MNQGAQELQFRELRDTILQLKKAEREHAEETAKLTAAITELTALIEALRAENAALKQDIANKQEQIDYLLGKIYGKSSEKRSKEDPNQLTLYELFNEAELLADPKAPEADSGEEPTPVREHTRRKKPKFDDRYRDLTPEKVLIELSEDELGCEICGTRREKIGERFVRRELNIVPQKVTVIEYYEAVYKCPNCEKENDTAYKDRPFITSARAPAPLIPHSMASPSVVATVACHKFVNGVPFNRQEAMWAEAGAPLSRATMANWIINTAEDFLGFMFEHFHRCLLSGKYLMADETRIQVLKEPERPAESDSYMWLYRTGEDGQDRKILLYDYQETRKGQNAADFLKGFQGYLETDGYAGYNKVDGIIRCCCWAHARRKFWDAIPASMKAKGAEMDYSLPAVQGFHYIDRVFRIEKSINKSPDFSYEKRYELRLQKEKPVLEAFWSWVERQRPVKGSKFEKAITYAVNQKTELMNYLLDGHCSLHNNDSERLAKTFAVGRKNWLFADTPRGARASAIYYSIIETAKANGLVPFKYLKFLLEQHISAEMSDVELSRFDPWNEDVRRLCSK